MSRRALAFLLAALFVARPASAQEDFTIAGIRVDVAAADPQAARVAGWRLAQRKAWPQLYSRLTGATPATAPRLGDGALDQIVSGIEVQREAIGPARYIATLAVAFDRGRASGYLGSSARLLRSAPMLIMPVELSGGTRIVFERRGPWAEAWRRFRTDMSPLSYIRPPGTGGDALVLNAYQAYRPNRELWRAALSRYSAANVLVAEARLDYAWPGGPVTGRFRAMAGPDSRVLEAFTLAASNDEEFATMLDLAVERIDAAYTAALRSGALRADQDLIAPIDDIYLGEVIGGYAPAIGSGEPLSTIVVTVAAPPGDEGAAAAFEVAILGAPGIQGAAAIGGNQIRIDYRGSFERLRYDLDQAGLRLDGTRLRQRLEGEALLPPPVIVAAAPDAPTADAAPVSPDAAEPPIVETDGPSPSPASPGPAPTPRDLTPPPALRPEDAPSPRPGG